MKKIISTIILIIFLIICIFVLGLGWINEIMLLSDIREITPHNGWIAVEYSQRYGIVVLLYHAFTYPVIIVLSIIKIIHLFTGNKIKEKYKEYIFRKKQKYIEKKQFKLQKKSDKLKTEIERMKRGE